MRKFHRLTALLGMAFAIAFTVTGLVGGALAPVAAAHGGSDVVGHVYINDNTAGTNTVAGFARHVDGSLTPLVGSPFAAGGAGTGTITGSQGSLQFSDDGRYLLVADAGSNQISVLRIASDGSLSLVGSPVWSGGVEPVSIAVHEDLVYVANTGAGGSNYTGFTLKRGGSLTPLSNSTFALPDGSAPGDVLFNGNGSRLVGTRVGTSQIDSFVVGETGRLTAAPGSPFAAQALGPFGSEFRPTNSSQLFVSNAHAGAGNGTISSFNDGGKGVLTAIGASPFADNQTAPCWVTITPDGRYLFTVNTGSQSISRFAIASNGTLTLLGSTPLSGTGLRSFDIGVSPDGRYAYVVDAGADAVSALANHHGALTELVGSPFAAPVGATPFGIVVD